MMRRFMMLDTSTRNYWEGTPPRVQRRPHSQHVLRWTHTLVHEDCARIVDKAKEGNTSVRDVRVIWSDCTDSLHWEKIRTRGKVSGKVGVYNVESNTKLSPNWTSNFLNGGAKAGNVDPSIGLSIPACMAIEQVDWAGNPQNNPYSQTYNLGC